MNGKLSDYFSKMKNAEPTEPLLSKDEARNILEGIDSTQSTTKNNWSKPMKIIGTFAIFAVSSFLAYNTFFTNDTEEKNIVFESRTAENIVEENETTEDLAASTKAEEETKVSHTDTKQKTKTTLEKFGIIKSKTGTSFVLASIIDHEQNPTYYKEVLEKGYPDKQEHPVLQRIYGENDEIGEIIPYSELNSYDPLNLPIDVTKKVSKNGQMSSTHSKGYAGYKLQGLSPDVSSILVMTVDSYISKLGKDKIKWSEIPNIPENKFEGVGIQNMVMNAIIKFAIPVYYKQEMDGLLYEYVAWYIPTEEFLAEFPKEMYNSHARKAVNREDIDSTYFALKQKFEGQAPEEQKPEQPDFDFANIKKIILDKNGLENLDIEVTGNTITFPTEQYYIPDDFPEEFQNKIKDSLGYPMDIGKGVMRGKWEATLDGIDSEILPYGGWSHDTVSYYKAVSVTGTLTSCRWNDYANKYEIVPGNYYGYHNSPLFEKLNIEHSQPLLTQNEDNTFSASISRLVPVVVELGTKEGQDSSKLNHAEVYIWFLATKEFAEKLPDEYRIPILKELDLISSIRNGDISIDEACAELGTSDSYFGICGLRSGSILSFNIAPNPVEGSNINFKIEMKNDSEIQIGLYDVAGNIIQSFGKIKAGTGYTESSLKLENKPSGGVYFLAIITDKGDKHISKVIIK